MRRGRGFTLLEMMVASVIMSVAVVGMLSGLAGSTRNAARLRDYDRVTQLARLRMNDLLVDPAFRPGAAVGGTFDPSLIGGLEAGWQARAFDFEQAPPAQSPRREKWFSTEIVLDIWWMVGEYAADVQHGDGAAADR